MLNRRVWLSATAFVMALPYVALAQAGTWDAAPPMRNARSAHNVVSTGDAIYALAGTGEGGKPVLEVEKFDGRAWSVETTLPGPGLNAPASAIVNGRIYVVGGFKTDTNIPTDEVLIYNIARRTWSKGAPLPAPRGGHAIAVRDGKIHVMGGGNSERTLADHTMYDPATNTWTSLAPLPRSKGSPAAVVVNNEIWAIGGRSGMSDFGEVDIWNAEQNAWRSGPAIEPRGTHGALVYNGAIYIFGGESQAKGASLSSVMRLDIARGQWTAAPDMPTARTYARAVLLGDAVYVVGGSPSAGNSHASTGGVVVERFRARS